MGWFFEIWIVTSLACPATIYKNMSPPWTEEDIGVIERAAVVCKRDYKRSPCVVGIAKSGEHSYQVICGAKR